MFRVPGSSGLRLRARAGRSLGFLAVELMAVIALSTMLVIWQAPTLVRQVEDAGMEATGVYMQIVNTALEKYNLTNHNALVTGGTVAGFANPLAPTIAELVAAKYIANPSFPSSVTRQWTPVLTRINLQNCPGVNCQLFGVAYLSQPLTLGGPDVRVDLVAKYLQSTNGAGMASQVTAPGTLASAAFNTPNPLGAVAGVLAIGTYLDEGLYSRFVQIGDTRDPALQGNATVAGTIQSGTAVGTNDGIAACLRAALSKTGQITSFAANCIARAWMDANGTVNAADATGQVRAQFDGNTGNITSYDASGNAKAGVRYSGGQSVLYADNLQNNNGTAGITASGAVYGNIGQFGSVVINNSAAAGGACTNAGEVVRSTVGSAPVLLVCQGGVYQAAGGLPVGVVGATCMPNGALGLTSTGVSLICSNGVWQASTDRMGHWAMADSVRVVNGSTVAKPACSGGGTAMVFEMPQTIDSSRLYTSFKAQDLGASWSIQIQDGLGNGLAGTALAMSGCWYF